MITDETIIAFRTAAFNRMMHENGCPEGEGIRAGLEAVAADLVASKDRRIAELESECKEAWRRRDAWKAKAAAYPEMAAAVHAKIKDEPATLSRLLLIAGYAGLQAKVAELEADNAALAAGQCIYSDGTGLVGDEHGNAVCAKDARIAELKAQVSVARDNALEEAAKVAEAHGAPDDDFTRAMNKAGGISHTASQIAGAIRAMKGTSNG